MLAPVGTGWRALSLSALAAGTLSSNGCGMFRCDDVITVHAPAELDDPSVGDLGIVFYDYGGPAVSFAPGERTARIEGGEFDGATVLAGLRMPDGTAFHGSGTTEERDAGLGNDTCLVTEIQLEPSDP